MIIKEKLRDLLYLFPDPVLFFFLERISRMKRIRLTKVGFSKSAGLYYIDPEDHDRVYVSHRTRLKYYSGGLYPRLDRLFSEYLLQEVPFSSGDIVLDCGANIGEIGLCLKAKGVKYYALEPDPVAHKACSFNMPGAVVDDRLLLDKSKTVEFFLASGSADSSAIRPSSKIDQIVQKEAITADDFIQQWSVERIKLFKIEAEGAEPEVLKGACKALEITEYVSIDCGPERGGEVTAPECLNILIDRGFRVVGVNLHRGVFLLRSSIGEPPFSWDLSLESRFGGQK